MADDLPQETFDASDPAAEANARRDAARFAREDADVLRNLMRTKQGRAWLLRRLDECHINNSPFVPGQADVTAYHLGEEAVGRRLLTSAMSASVDLYMTAIKEAQEEERRVAEVRRKEALNRAEREGPIDVAGLVADLPPPAGYPGGPPLPKKKKDN
jgi:hypothetical protein